ncbi:MAG: patatin-like phospholipase family protein [Pseudomonadales bacterium]
MAKYRIITFDGGGLRGVVTTGLLRQVLAQPGCENLLRSADLFAGTSTGGLIALGLAAGNPLDTVHNLYLDRADDIFKDTVWDNVKDLGKAVGADYSTTGLRKEVRAILGDKTLGQLSPRVLITSFDLDNEDIGGGNRSWKPKLWHNFPGSGNDRKATAWKVALYTSAAPTYFPSVDGYIDGGVFANNPSMCALAQTQDQRYQPTPGMHEIVMLSLGTGITQEYIRKKKLDWGYAQWVKPLINIMMDGVAGISDFQCKQLLGDRYLRVSPKLPKNYQIDDHRKVQQMARVGEDADITELVAWLQEHWFPTD